MLVLCLGLGWLSIAAAAEKGPIAVGAGQEFKITLQYNATTGYQWRFAKPPEEKFIKLLGTEYKKPNAKVVGAGGDEVWTFKALAAGKTTLALDYVRPWEKGGKPARSTNFVIVVKAAKAETKK